MKEINSFDINIDIFKIGEYSIYSTAGNGIYFHTCIFFEFIGDPDYHSS